MDMDSSLTATEVATLVGFPPMPPKISEAVLEVMGGVKRLEKDEKNIHGNYKFAGIDSFLDLVRPLCVKAKLVITTDEESIDFRDSHGKDGKTRNWLVARFRFTLSHSSGETWQHRPTRTIMVDASMGSQSFGAAQSYALKQFQRSLFQIATGENEDADTHPPADLPRGKTLDKSPPSVVSAPTAAQAAAAKKWVTEAIDHIDGFRTGAEMGAWEEDNAAKIDKLRAHPAEAERMNAAINAKMDSLGMEPANG